jgi:hypothetical protein
VKAPARFVSTVNRFGLGRGKVARVATPFCSRNARGTSARSSQHPLALTVMLLASVAVVFAVTVPAASAAPTAQSGYGYLTTGEFGAGEVLGSFEATHNPIALDSYGNVLIADAAGAEFNPGHESLALFAPDTTVGGTLLTKQSLPGTNYPTDLAIDPGTDALYVQGFSPYDPKIHRYLSDGNLTPTYTLDPGFEVPLGQGTAVDPTTHDLLVADSGAQAVKRYDTSGALVSTIATPGINPERLAVAHDGSIYISGNNKIVHFSGAGVSLGEVANAAGILAVNPATGILVVANGDHLKGYSPAGEFLFEALMPINNASSIAIDGNSGRLYAYNGGSYFVEGGGAVYTFLPAVYPGVEAPLVSNITPTSAHVSAEVDPGEEPGGGLPEESELCFEYKLAAAATWEPGPCQSLSGPETKEADITGLEPNLDYLVRAQARNSKAGNLYASHTSAPTTFHTTPVAPKTETNDATDISETGAVLNGTINPVGLPTTYHFEYGTTTAYGSRVPAGIEAVAGADYNNRRLGRTITGLAPGTTYHFRLVAQNSVGAGEGADRTFTTAPLGAVTHRAYEQVTPVDKGGIPILEGFAFQAKVDGSAISYGTQGNSVSAPFPARSMSLRGGGDWTGGVDLDPPLNRPIETIVGATTLAVSADFTHTFVATNRKLTPDAIEDGQDRANLYVVDITTGAHTLIATAPTGLINFIGIATAYNFYAGAPDFSWIVFRSTPPLKPGAPEKALYRWSATGGLEVVSVLPHGEMASVAAGDNGPFVRSVSADGSRIYFTVFGGGLEEGFFLKEEGHPTKAISVPHIPGDPTAPHRAFPVGVSKDGRYAFFFSGDGGKLTTDAPGGGADMYRYDASGDSLEYLGAAARFDNSSALYLPIAVGDDGQTAYWIGPNGSDTLVWRDGVVNTVAPHPLGAGANASPSPNGRYLAFQEAGDIFLYDAATDQRHCVSCLPDGSPGGGYLRNFGRIVSNRNEQAATNAGQVFYTTSTRLVAADVNGSEDVYEYKDGKTTLISPGNAPFNAIFADSSEDGSDVFFTTPQKLVGQDNDKTVDLYDARIGGGLAKQNPPPPQECLRDDCKATPNVGPELPFGGSEALSGPGNVSGEARKRCAKGTHARKVGGKTRCVKQSKVKKKAKSTKRANTNRRQGR